EDSNDELPCHLSGGRETQTVLGYHKGRWIAEVSAGCWNKAPCHERSLLIRNQGRHGPSWSRAAAGRQKLHAGSMRPTRAGADQEHIGILVIVASAAFASSSTNSTLVCCCQGCQHNRLITSQDTHRKRFPAE